MIKMGPPLYGDLGKQARDIFSKGYHFDLIKLDIKTKTPTGVEFATGGTSQIESGKVFGTIESKYKFKDYGLLFSEKWNTNNVLSTELSLTDFFPGTKISADCSFAPQTSEKSARVKSQFVNQLVAINAEAEFKAPLPLVSLAAVLGHKGWLCGYHLKFDTKSNKLKSNKLSLGYSAKDFHVQSQINDGKEFGSSIYQKVSPKLEIGVDLAWFTENNDTKLGIGLKYNLENNAALKAKVDNQSRIGLGYSQTISPGVTIYLSTQLDGQNFNQGGHKLGFALDFDL
ncbi:voltage-dependent anion-selective channel isoform X1 [Bemisia tabaci]|uniref:voltage-dependent anion-selective channel isoform X1 n=1 Tax=Bemisia tabaci TaxID=7038 RepID=UPI003B287C44